MSWRHCSRPAPKQCRQQSLRIERSIRKEKRRMLAFTLNRALKAAAAAGSSSALAQLKHTKNHSVFPSIRSLSFIIIPRSCGYAAPGANSVVENTASLLLMLGACSLGRKEQRVDDPCNSKFKIPHPRAAGSREEAGLRLRSTRGERGTPMTGYNSLLLGQPTASQLGQP